MLVPKGQYSFRPSTQLDILDAFIFTGLVYEAGDEFEKSRISPSSKNVFSWRFAPTEEGQMYSDVASQWKAFEAQSELLASEYTFVVVTDIADFYPRLYHHPIENAISKASPLRHHANCIMRILRQFSFWSSYGIPVGCSASRLIAEISLNDVDSSLKMNGIEYCRYVDDFRLFANSEGEAREILVAISKILFENHGLTLAPQKTHIYRSEDFIHKILLKHEIKERKELEEKISVILENVGNFMEYPTMVNFESLSDEEKAELKKYSLREILEQELTKSPFDLGWTKFLIMSLCQAEDREAINVLIQNLSKLAPAMNAVGAFFSNFISLTNDERLESGNRILHQLSSDPIINHEYIRMILLSLFASGKLLGSSSKLLALYNQFPDQATRREIILALGLCGQRHWFLTQRKNYDDLRPWERRAFIWASRCLTTDERKYWLKSVDGRFDILEKILSRTKKPLLMIDTALPALPSAGQTVVDEIPF